MCGITGICLAERSTAALPELIEASLFLQHRGQDACGVATFDSSGKPTVRKRLGLVAEAFGEERAEDLLSLTGSMGIAHVRYRTMGRSTLAEAQPLQSLLRPDVLLCHNGHLTNAQLLRDEFNAEPLLSAFGTGDSAAILHILASNLPDSSVKPSSIFRALEAVYHRCRGAFACIATIGRDMMVGFRDPYGLKPLMVGERINADGWVDYMFASESVALEKLDFMRIFNVLPGEAVIIDRSENGPLKLHAHNVAPIRSYTPDVFEYVYLARPDSMLDGISVQSVRLDLGRALASTITRQINVDNVDVVIPVPETSYTSALSAAQALEKPLAFGFVKNRYVGRTFIMPDQAQRRKGIARKLSVVKEEFEGKHVLLVDDSIVRGTTSKAIVKMAFAAGAREVTFASASPAIRYNHIHGIDLADSTELIAHSRNHEQVRQALGCDNLVYLPLEDLVQSCLRNRTDGRVGGFEVGVFSGVYITDDNTGQCHAHVDMDRADSALKLPTLSLLKLVPQPA